MASRPHTAGPVAARAALLDRLLCRHGGALRRQAAKHSRRASDAEDALGDACLAFLRAYNGPAESSSALPWLMLALKHSAWKLGARCRREAVSLSATGSFDPEHPALTIVDERQSPPERAERAEEIAERRSMLAQLKPDERTALLLFALGFSYREIMARQGWTWTKVNRCLAEGRAALRELAERSREDRGA